MAAGETFKALMDRLESKGIDSRRAVAIAAAVARGRGWPPPEDEDDLEEDDS